MHEYISLDDIDQRIIHALQIQPRAPWKLVAAIVSSDPTTVMRRWRRMVDAGAAWIAAYPPFGAHATLSLVEVGCAHGHTLEVASQLAMDPQVMSVNVHAGHRDLLVEVIGADVRQISNYLLERLALVEGIRWTRAHTVIASYADGNAWRMGALGRADERRLLGSGTRPADFAGSSARAARPILSAAEEEVAHVLAGDPRTSLTDLAKLLNVSVTTAGRRLEAVLRTQPMLRCEVAQSLSGWPVHATFFFACPAERVETTGQALAKLREARAAMTTTGPHNFYLAVWLRSLGDVQRLEVELATRLPHLVVVDRTLQIRPIKRIGHLLDEDGWTTGRVPIELGGPSLEVDKRDLAGRQSESSTDLATRGAP
jgi:DNA-binding Lrp family transcriptional regulator